MDWGFYGRHGEIGFLREFMDGELGFDTLAIRGRRQVGKSDLIRHFFAQEFPASEDRPVIVLDLSGADRSLFYGRVRIAARRARSDLLEGFQPPEDDLEGAFPDLVEHLLGKGCAVVLDEFQRIADPHDRMPALFQSLIDRLHLARLRADRDGRARLIVMGSEQQKLMDMFLDCRAPLYNRIRKRLHLRPWDFAELVEAAQDRGWDRRPERLLTLWTAYGGMPAHWRRFSENRALADFGRSMPDAAWTDAFLEGEEAYRRTEDGRFDRQMEVELRPGDRELLAWLAEKPGGHMLRDLPAGLRPALAAEFRKREPDRAELPEDRAAVEAAHDAVVRRLSGEHLGLLERRNAVDDPDGAERWHVADNNARFHLDVLEKAERETATLVTAPPGAVASRFRERMQHAEGRGLETLAFAALGHLFEAGCAAIPPVSMDKIRLERGAWRKDPGSPEIDLLAIEWPAIPEPGVPLTDPGLLWAGFAKRAPDRHRPDKDCRTLAAWLAPVPENRRAESSLAPLRGWDHYLLFVSPVFGKRDIEELANKVDRARAAAPGETRGWFAMDIADMLSGRGPRSLAPPEPEESPDQDDPDEPGFRRG